MDFFNSLFKTDSDHSIEILNIFLIFRKFFMKILNLIALCVYDDGAKDEFRLIIINGFSNA